jgi:hypothetical protein
MTTNLGRYLFVAGAMVVSLATARGPELAWRDTGCYRLRPLSGFRPPVSF